MPFVTLPPFGKESGLLNVILETPKGSRNKFSYDPGLGLFKLKKTLPAGAVFPFDFGFIPSTVGEDGDPLDVLVLMDEPAFPGCLVEARLLGVMEVAQTKKGKTERNDRFIASAKTMKALCNVSSVKGLNPDVLEQIEHFFVSYNAIEGKKFKLLRISDAGAARKLIEKGAAAYQKTNQESGMA
jgi:inorganic pyrophosphatase